MEKRRHSEILGRQDIAEDCQASFKYLCQGIKLFFYLLVHIRREGNFLRFNIRILSVLHYYADIYLNIVVNY